MTLLDVRVATIRASPWFAYARGGTLMSRFRREDGRFLGFRKVGRRTGRRSLIHGRRQARR